MMSARAKCRPRSGWWWHTVNHTKIQPLHVLQVLTGEVQLHNTAQVSLHQRPNMVFQAPDFPWFRRGYTGECNRKAQKTLWHGCVKAYAQGGGMAVSGPTPSQCPQLEATQDQQLRQLQMEQKHRPLLFLLNQYQW